MQKVNPKNLLCVISILAVFSQYSFAAEGTVEAAGTSTSENVTIGQLEAIQSRNFLLELQLQAARLTKQLRESETQSISSPIAISQPQVPFIPAPAGVAGSVTSSQSAGASQVTPRIADSVRLQEIYGKGTHLRARIILPQGGVTEVVNGDQIPSSKLRVTAISATAVKLSDGSELSF